MIAVTVRKNHRCRNCGKAIAAGSTARMESFIVEKFYPVKGIMRFNRRMFFHVGCESKSK